jgi:ribosomal protein L7/L12
MLMFGLFVAVVAMILTRKSEIVTHDPSTGLPKQGGGASPFSGVVDVMKDIAKQMEEQAREQQRRQQQGPSPRSSGPLPRPGASPNPSVDLEEIRDLVQRGQVIDAIRLYRMKFRVGLKEAKEAVEKLNAGA